MSFQITEPIVRTLLHTVDAGLVNGLGQPTPGHMCVEAAISYALGEPHSDGPSCVEPVVRAAKIALNDKSWSSPRARARGLRAVAIAQLGSTGVVDPKRFVTLLSEYTIREIVPIALRAAAKAVGQPHAAKLEECAVRCEREGTKEAARAAADAAAAAAYAADAAANDRDRVLALSASLMVRALQECGSPGCDWLWLLDEIPLPA